MTGIATPDGWRGLEALTPARIALGRAGAGLPTGEALRLALAHARARDAVHAPFDAEAVGAGIEELGLETIRVASAAAGRETYLARPDLGRRLDRPSREALEAARVRAVDLALVIADGLSSHAVHRHAVPLLKALKPLVERQGWSLAPVVLASQARVALGDEAGEALGARAVAVVIGERPGLSSPDSLGIYVTFAPRPGRHDGERNCISNIHGAGLACQHAAFKLVWLLREAFARKLTGVALKDESDRDWIEHGRAGVLPAGAGEDADPLKANWAP